MAALCWRCFQIHFLLPVCQILTRFGTEHCISYWGTHCHYHVQHILKNRLWRKFREMYSSVTSEGLAPWWPSCARSNLIYIESLCRHVHWTLQPRTFTNKYSVKLAMVSHIVLRIVCSSVAIPNVIWILKKKKRMVGNPLRIKPITKNPLMRHQGCFQSSTGRVLIIIIKYVYSSYSCRQITAQLVYIRPYRDRRSGRITACANLICPYCPFLFFVS